MKKFTSVLGMSARVAVIFCLAFSIFCCSGCESKPSPPKPVPAPAPTPKPSPAPTPPVPKVETSAAKDLLNQKMGGECSDVVELDMKNLGVLRGAEAEIAFCNEYSGDVVVTIHATGFTAGENYWLTLNGWEGRPGNEELKKYNTDKGVGFFDFATVTVEANGELESYGKTKLAPSDYEVKIFVKQSEPPYSVLMGVDTVRFTVEAEVAVTLILPDELRGPKNLVEGKVKDPKTSKVFVFVHPMEIDTWYCQQIPVPDKNGSWRIMANFGEGANGAGEYFETVAIIGEENQFQQGEKKSSNEMTALLNKYESSAIVAKKRID